MDYLSLKAAAAEADRKLSGSKIADAWQAGRNEVVLLPGRGGGLVLSIDPVRPGLYLMKREQVPERSSSPFTDLLRARIKGTTLGPIHIPEPGERIAALTFSAAWPAKKGKAVRMLLEVMGRRSNLLLLEEGLILQPLRTVPPEKSPVRPVVAGRPYRPPPPMKGVPIDAVTADAMPPLGSRDDIDSLLGAFRGLSPYSASQALLGIPASGSDSLPETATVVLMLKEMLSSCTGHTGYLHRTGTRIYLSPFEPKAPGTHDRIEKFNPFSEAAAAWRKAHPEGTADSGDEIAILERELEGRLERISSALQKVDSEEERCLAHDELRIMAEALLINVSRVDPDQETVTLPDPYDPGIELNIPMDRTRSPQENANELFSKARRLKRGLVEVGLRRKALEKESLQVRRALESLAQRRDPEPARKLLEEPGIPRISRGRTAGPARSGPGRRYTVDGFTILVGKGAEDNDKVTFQAAGPHDLWLHARNYPGSHVVIITEKRKVPDEVLYEAAALAAARSGAKNDAAPEIMVTERKWVHKLKGGKPGQVTVQRYRTIRPGKRR